MHGEYNSMQSRIKRLQETNTMLANRCFSQQRLINKMMTLIKDTVKWMDKKKIAPSVKLDKFRKDFEL
jgi:hypothetical protein